MNISIGNISFSVFCAENQAFDKTIDDRYDHFLTGYRTDYEIEVILKPVKDLLVKPFVETEKPLISITRENGNYLLERLDNPFFAKLDKEARHIEITMSENPYCFDSFLRVLFVVLLAEEGGLLLHSCSVDDYGQGRVFFGPSEAGKSTIASLAAGRRVLSDELTIIRKVDGKYRVYGTPFWGEFKAGHNNYDAELKGLYSLEKGTANQLLPISMVAAINKLFRCAMYFGSVPEISHNILDSCVDIISVVPSNRLIFKKDDESFWDIVSN